MFSVFEIGGRSKRAHSRLHEAESRLMTNILYFTYTHYSAFVLQVFDGAFELVVGMALWERFYRKYMAI